MTDVDQLCADIYSEARSRFGARPLGFRVLYGPPVYRPPIFFIGYQPGGGLDRKDAHLHDAQMQGYPREFDYVTADWLLAKRARYIWGVDVLRRCCASNLIFPRASDKKTWAQTESLAFRRSVEAFGREKLRQLIEAMRPEKLVVIGTTTLRELEKADVVAQSKTTARRLVRRGVAFGVKAEAVTHLSGARISSEDLDEIKAYFNR